MTEEEPPGRYTPSKFETRRGFPKHIRINQHGVIDDSIAEVVEYKTKKAFAKVRVLELPNGWVYNVHYQYHHGSYGGFASPMRLKGDRFASREDALREGLGDIIRGQGHVADGKGSCVTKPQIREAKKIILWAKRQMRSLSPQQLTLDTFLRKNSRRAVS